LRPFLGSQTPVYATSQVNSTDDQVANLDLNGVHLVDMPWLVRPEDPAVALYPRPPTLERDVARFYALGIDTYRIAAALLEGRRAFEFDGVTGHISVTDTGAVERRPIAATFQDGKCVALR
jgi:outer membrane PBP1 activator LpoA protein